MKSLPRHVIPASLVVVALVGMTLTSQSAGAQNPSPGSAPVNVVSPLPLPVTIASPSPIPVSGTIAVASNREPIQVVDSAIFLPGEISKGRLLYTVPESKRLIIEDMSARTQMHPGQTVDAHLTVSGGEFYVRHMTFIFQHRITVTEPVSNPVQDIFVAGGLVRIVVGPGQKLSLEGRRSASEGLSLVSAGVSGYLEDVAQ